jgi:hypothetical protein
MEGVMKKIYYLILLIFVLTSCTPSSEAIQTAIALTQGPKVTVAPTDDIRVIKSRPKDLILSRFDLPLNDQYYPRDSYRIANSDIISDWGEEKANEFIEKTGRIDGWFISFYPDNPRKLLSPLIFQKLVQYETTEGANLALMIHHSNENSELTVLEESYDLGDSTIIYRLRRLSDSSEYLVTYRVETAYQNYTSIIDCFGRDDKLNVEIAINFAEIALSKLEEAPLVNP